MSPPSFYPRCLERCGPVWEQAATLPDSGRHLSHRLCAGLPRAGEAIPHRCRPDPVRGIRAIVGGSGSRHAGATFKGAGDFLAGGGTVGDDKGLHAAGGHCRAGCLSSGRAGWIHPLQRALCRGGEAVAVRFGSGAAESSVPSVARSVCGRNGTGLRGAMGGGLEPLGRRSFR